MKSFLRGVLFLALIQPLTLGTGLAGSVTVDTPAHVRRGKDLVSPTEQEYREALRGHEEGTTVEMLPGGSKLIRERVEPAIPAPQVQDEPSSGAQQ